VGVASMKLIRSNPSNTRFCSGYELVACYVFHTLHFLTFAKLIYDLGFYVLQLGLKLHTYVSRWLYRTAAASFHRLLTMKSPYLKHWAKSIATALDFSVKSGGTVLTKIMHVS
jgi:hypothetical protein